MTRRKIVVTDRAQLLVPEALQLMRDAGHEVVIAQELNEQDPVAVAKDADALYVIWQPMPREELSRLEKCRVLMRLGVGYEIIDANAARDLGIAVCNVPDYCTNEVADHAFSMALALARELVFLDKTVRGGTWIPELPYKMPAFETLTFGTLGFGRIAQAVLRRAAASEFSVIAYDPFLPDEAFVRAGVRRVTLDELFAQVDILSIHAPLTDETRHVVNAERLKGMKPNAIIVNTARGGLIDTVALAEAVQNRTIAAAGIDVFEKEPPPADHPILHCPNVLVTPHWAWHSQQSEPRLHIKGAEVIVNALRGEPMTSCVNGFTRLEGI